MTLAFVNINGQPVNVQAMAPKKVSKLQPASFHRGWRVVGVPPGELEEARAAHIAMQEQRKAAGKEVKPWDEAQWLMNARKKPVRSKPYEVEAAARDCRMLAERAGWLALQLVEVKKEAA